MSSMMDKLFLALLAPNANYLPIAIDGLLVHTLFDKGNNTTMLNKKLAEQLSLNIAEYTSTI